MTGLYRSRDVFWGEAVLVDDDDDRCYVGDCPKPFYATMIYRRPSLRGAGRRFARTTAAAVARTPRGDLGRAAANGP